LNEGPTDFDRRHNLVVSGTVLVPKTGGLTVSAVARALSGSPMTVQDTNTDPDRNGILFDPLPAGDYSGTGSDAYSVTSEGGRNGAYGPGFFQIDLRFGYRLRVGGGKTLDLFGEIFNLANRANFDNPTGDRRSTNFLLLTALRAGAVRGRGRLACASRSRYETTTPSRGLRLSERRTMTRAASPSGVARPRIT